MGGYPVFRWTRNLGKWAKAGWGWKAVAVIVGFAGWGQYTMSRQFQIIREYMREEMEIHMVSVAFALYSFAVLGVGIQLGLL